MADRGATQVSFGLSIPRLLYRQIFRREMYNVGLVHAPIHRFLDADWRPEIHWLPRQAKRGAFLADPFGFEHEGKRYLLCEYFDYSEPGGRIVCGEMKDPARADDLKDVEFGPCHISYPFVFVHEGQAFCIPETSQAKELALYKMEAFPSKWRKEGVLLQADAVDSSMVQYDGRWWLFYGLRSTRGAELFVSYADDPRGPWLPHAKQPVKKDAASSRSGGTPFVHMGKLYRPAQDCSQGYGRRLVINEVLALSPTEFEEKVVAAVEADKNSPYPHGRHTLSAFGEITLIDGKREQFIWSAVARSARNLWRSVSKRENAEATSSAAGDKPRGKTPAIKGGIILVGGFPEPVGGVTTFVRRLAASDKRIEEVVDICPGRKKEIPADFSGRHRALNSKWRGFVYLFFRMMVWRNKYMHFNFSSLTSVMFFLFLPKNTNKWILMLHHGVLESRIPNSLIGHLLRRFDYIVYMNEGQSQKYRLYGVGDDKLVRASSYVQPQQTKPDKAFQQDVDSYFSAKPTLVASGYPTALYNLDWCIRFVSDREEFQLALFVYGDGSEKAEIQKQQSKLKNIRVYWDEREENFNYALSRAKCYLRPNMKDSFGIAVADAVNYGVPVLASDVCPRYQGAETFRITTFESFEKALVNSLNNEGKGNGHAAPHIVPFSYDLIA